MIFTIKSFLFRRLVVCCVILSFFFHTNKSIGQKSIGWDILADITFEETFDEEEDAYWLAPSFGDVVKSYENQVVVVEGYLIPIDVAENIYLLSKYPYSACFFCGGAGPESIVELQLEKRAKGRGMDDRVRLQGRLVLNTADFDHFNYILKAALFLNGD